MGEKGMEGGSVSGGGGASGIVGAPMPLASPVGSGGGGGSSKLEDNVAAIGSARSANPGGGGRAGVRQGISTDLVAIRGS
jgi:hypothetical protein